MLPSEKLLVLEAGGRPPPPRAPATLPLQLCRRPPPPPPPPPANDALPSAHVCLLDAAGVGYAAYLGSLRLAHFLSPLLSQRYRDMPAPERLEWNARLPSTLHAVAITAATVYLFVWSPVFADGAPRPQGGSAAFVLRTSPLSDAALGFSLGYFATDLLLLCLYFPHFGGPEMALHHVAALASVAAAAFQASARRWRSPDTARCVAWRTALLLPLTASSGTTWPTRAAGSGARLHAGAAGHRVHHAFCQRARGSSAAQPRLTPLGALPQPPSLQALQMRYLLDKGGWRDHPVYTVNGMALLVRWAASRCGPVPAAHSAHVCYW